MIEVKIEPTFGSDDGSQVDLVLRKLPSGFGNSLCGLSRSELRVIGEAIKVFLAAHPVEASEAT
jgi:hypothetical protein